MRQFLLNDGRGVLPPLYGEWIDELLAGPIPPETDATCDDCPMLPQDGEQPTGLLFFDSIIKCCTYIPDLPNFLVGRILGDDDAALARGRATVEARIRAGVAVTPVGLHQTPTYRLLYQHKDISAFGRSRTLRCQHYIEESGSCGIWRHRASVCSTWFCKYVRGDVSLGFWRAMNQLLSAVERDLACWCVLRLDVGTQALQSLFPPASGADQTRPINADELDGVISPETHRAIWGNWSNREGEFYKECARLVNSLTWHDVTAICGPAVQIFAQLVRDAYRKLVSNEIPPSLKGGSFNVLSIRPDFCRVSSYGGCDPIDLSKALMEALRYFDGRPISEALQALAEDGIRLDEGLIRRLVDFRILIPGEHGNCDTPNCNVPLDG